MPDHDPVNHPEHYTQGPIEVIEIIEGFKLGFTLGNAIKYILRAPHKNAELEDLKKARWYLDREIASREGNAGDTEKTLELPAKSDKPLSQEWLEKAMGVRMRRSGRTYFGEPDSGVTIMATEYGYYATVESCEIESCQQAIQLILATGGSRGATT